MKHADTTQWADYVRGLVNDETRSEMSAHLDSGCRRCAGTVAFLSRVGELPAADAASEPPDGVVRSIKAYFGLQAGSSTSRASELAMRLVADSFLMATPAGVRNDQAEGRSLSYEGDDHALELQMKAYPRASEVELTGELFSHDAGPVAGAPAFLLAGGQVVSQSSTDEFGAFALSGHAAAANRLCLVLEDGATVSIGLPEIR